MSYRLKFCVLAVVAASALSAGVAVSGVRAQSVPIWVGAWEWLHDTNAGRLLILDGWFCAVYGARDRTAPEGPLPETTKASLFRSMSGPMCGQTSAEVTSDGTPVLVTRAEFTARPDNAGGVVRRPTRVEGDLMEGDVLRSDGSIQATWRYRRLSPLGTSALAGAWRLAPGDWAGILVFTDSQYRFVIHHTDRSDLASGAPRNLTDRQAAALYDAYDAEGGSYQRAGSSLSRVPDVARDPRIQGRSIETPFDLQGDTLSLRLGAKDLVWVRIG